MLKTLLWIIGFIVCWPVALAVAIINWLAKKGSTSAPVHKNSTTNKTTPTYVVTINSNQDAEPVLDAKGYVPNAPKQSMIYRLTITDEGKLAFSTLAAMTRFDSWAYGKELWTKYYAKACEVFTNVKALHGSGIYKITNSSTGMIYIGQAKDIQRRWKDHVRVGCGADFPSSMTQLYKDMYVDGPESFSFQVIDYCANNKYELDRREAYWIQFYDSNNSGYNRTRGNSVK